MSVTVAPAGTTGGVRSTNHRALDEPTRRRVVGQMLRRDVRCRCGGRGFGIGDALEMGSIWPDEPLGTYLVALTCLDCGARDGVRMDTTDLTGAGASEPV